MASTRLEQLHPGLTLRSTAVGAPVLSALLLGFAPHMALYGGLSGLATGMVMLVALAHITLGGTERITGVGLLALLLGKLAYDAGGESALLARFASPGVRSSPLAHALGAGLAVVVFNRAGRKRDRSSHPDSASPQT